MVILIWVFLWEVFYFTEFLMRVAEVVYIERIFVMVQLSRNFKRSNHYHNGTIPQILGL